MYLYPCRRTFAVVVLAVEPALRWAGHKDDAQQEEAHESSDDRFRATRYHHRHSERTIIAWD